MVIQVTNAKKCYILPSSDKRSEAIKNSKWGVTLGCHVARSCSGGNILLERGKIVTSYEYEKRKKEVLCHAF